MLLFLVDEARLRLDPLSATVCFELSVQTYWRVTSCNPFDVAVQLYTRCYADVSIRVYLGDPWSGVTGLAMSAY